MYSLIARIVHKVLPHFISQQTEHTFIYTALDRLLKHPTIYKYMYVHGERYKWYSYIFNENTQNALLLNEGSERAGERDGEKSSLWIFPSLRILWFGCVKVCVFHAESVYYFGLFEPLTDFLTPTKTRREVCVCARYIYVSVYWVHIEGNTWRSFGSYVLTNIAIQYAHTHRVSLAYTDNGK